VVDQALAALLKNEHDYWETFERMKLDLESSKGFSTKKCFMHLDLKNRNYLQPSVLTEFMKVFAMGEPRLMPTKQRISGILRRLASSTDSRITFNEFAAIIQPAQVNVYKNKLMRG